MFALIVGCRSQNRNTYFSDLRSQSTRNASNASDLSNVGDFQGLVLIALESIDTDLAGILSDKGLMPGYSKLREIGEFSTKAPLRLSSEKMVLGLSRLKFENDPTEAAEKSIPSISLAKKFSFAPDLIKRKKSLLCQAIEHSAQRTKELLPLQTFQAEIVQGELCLNRKKLELFIDENKFNQSPETLASHIHADLLFSNFLKTLAKSKLQNALLLTVGTIALIEPTKVQVTPKGEVSASGKILVQKMVKKVEKTGQAFAPLQFIRSNGKDDLAFAEISKLSINNIRLIDYFSSVLGNGYYLVPWDLHQNQDHLTTQLIIDHHLGRRSKIELDYGFNDRFKHTSVTPIGAIDIEELTEYDFGYLTEEEWMLLSLRERNNEMRLIPGLGQSMLFSQEIDAGFLFVKSDFFKSSLFSFSTLNSLRGKEESLSLEALIPTPTLRSLNSLISEWQQAKKIQDPKILNE